MSARIDDHTAWAARGYWRHAYESLLADTRTDTIPDPMQDPRVKSLVEAAEALRARLDAAMRGRTWSMPAMTDAARFDHALSTITKEPPHER